MGSTRNLPSDTQKATVSPGVCIPSVCLDKGFCKGLLLIVCLYHDNLFPGSGTIIPLCIYLCNTKGKEWVPSLLLQYNECLISLGTS